MRLLLSAMQNRRSPVPGMLLPTTTQDAPYEGNKSQVSKLSAWATAVGGTEAPRTLKLVASGVLLLLVVFMLVPSSGAALLGSQVGSLVRTLQGAPNQLSLQLKVVPPSMKLAVIADLDQQSRTAGDKPTWRSIFKEVGHISASCGICVTKLSCRASCITMPKTSSTQLIGKRTSGLLPRYCIAVHSSSTVNACTTEFCSMPRESEGWS